MRVDDEQVLPRLNSARYARSARSGEVEPRREQQQVRASTKDRSGRARTGDFSAHRLVEAFDALGLEEVRACRIPLDPRQRVIVGRHPAVVQTDELLEEAAALANVRPYHALPPRPRTITARSDRDAIPDFEHRPEEV